MIGRWPPPLVRTLISATNRSRCLLSSVGAGSAGTVGTGRLERDGWNGTVGTGRLERDDPAANERVSVCYLRSIWREMAGR